MSGRARVLAVLVALIAPAPAVGGSAQQVPYLTGRVVDLAELISESDRRRIEGKLVTFEEESGSQVAVLTVPSLEGEAIEDYAIRVAETWQLGRAEVDNGVLLLIAREERQMRLEVGYGLEPSLTDARSRRILDGVIRPRFREGDFGGGVEAGVDAILATIRGEVPSPVAEPIPAVRPPVGQLLAIVIQLLFFLFLVFMISRMRGRRARHQRTWSSRSGWDPYWSERPRDDVRVILIPPIFPGGGSRGSGGWGGGSSRSGFGGGGFSGGGGSFGGGGASSGW